MVLRCAVESPIRERFHGKRSHVASRHRDFDSIVDTGRQIGRRVLASGTVQANILYLRALHTSVQQIVPAVVVAKPAVFPRFMVGVKNQSQDNLLKR